ncbi:Putative protein [Zobellia galactanivorans]|uniref:Uncharacterized protein n=1 Tax=Zobellia galactanivorans (strain DSM 12802 / CCUG 47099 / CIP 106680 / NCIMB 13871 / Dsij) TaxID=63186 RepID=G0L8F2_ZOBGA|nr:hypothetical protein B4Q04_21725 [Zobellia sp. OII3]CAZ97516.1 Putative protein [Zobellia galactanivorans]
MELDHTLNGLFEMPMRVGAERNGIEKKGIRLELKPNQLNRKNNDTRRLHIMNGRFVPQTPRRTVGKKTAH